MTDLTIRWAVGSPAGHPLPARSMRMLGLSMLAAWRLWPDARRVLMVNQGPDDQRATLQDLGAKMQAEVLDGCDFDIDHIPDPAVFENRPWWKWAPLRLDTSTHELWLDADCIVWAEPPGMTEWLADPHAGMVGLYDVGYSNHPDHSVGSFREVVGWHINVNSGFVGLGPGQSWPYKTRRDLWPSPACFKKPTWGDDQGWVNACLLHEIEAAEFPSHIRKEHGVRRVYRVGLDELVVPFNRAAAERALARPEIYGIHVIVHSLGQEVWYDEFEPEIARRIKAIR